MIIIGAGGHAKVIADILLKSGIQDIQFWVDQPGFNTMNGFSVSQRQPGTEEPLIIGIGDNRTRKKVAGEIKGTFSKAIHPTSIISNFVSIGEGTVCMAGSIINSNATIGKHVILNTGAVVDHDARISDYVHISPNATLAGSVAVGEGSWIGAGATIIQGVTIGKWAIVGAGAVVIRDVPDFAVVVGNPAKIIKQN